MNQIVIDAADALNKQADLLTNIKVPVLKGYDEFPNPGTIFSAVAITDSVEQFLCDGIIEDTFEEHIDKSIEQTKEAMKLSGMEVNDDTIFYLDDFQSSDFLFRVYIQDCIAEGMIVRQFNMYFMDPKTNAFYQIALSTAPYPTSMEEHVKNELTDKMMNTLETLMLEVHY